MKNIKLTSMLLIILLSVFLGCVNPPAGTPTPTAKPTVVETIQPTNNPIYTPTSTIPIPESTPKTSYPITYKVWMDSDSGFTNIRAINGTTYIPLPFNFDKFNLTINVGDKLRWINDDSYDFPLTIISNEGLWSNRTGYLRYNNANFEYIFNKTGTFTFSIKEAHRNNLQRITVNP